MGYFLCLNDNIATTNAAKVTANINASNTDIGIQKTLCKTVFNLFTTIT